MHQASPLLNIKAIVFAEEKLWFTLRMEFFSVTVSFFCGVVGMESHLV